MPYRRVTYLEICWYMIKWGLKNGFDIGGRKERKHERNKYSHRKSYPWLRKNH